MCSPLEWRPGWLGRIERPRPVEGRPRFFCGPLSGRRVTFRIYRWTAWSARTFRQGETMNRKSALLASTIAAFFLTSPVWGQSSGTGPGNPTLLEAVQNLQASVNALQGAVNNIITNGVAAQRRRFYLTPGTVDGANAANACQSGFHMASLWEI